MAQAVELGRGRCRSSSDEWRVRDEAKKLYISLLKFVGLGEAMCEDSAAPVRKLLGRLGMPLAFETDESYLMATTKIAADR
jgi:hypothetical protein